MNKRNAFQPTAAESTGIWQVDRKLVHGEYVSLDGGEPYYRIANSHLMPSFFMSLISADDHWMFVASNGAMTCGRRNADHALFPYYSSDKLLDMAGTTGSTTIIQTIENDRASRSAWEPFGANSSAGDIVRNLYKNIPGTRLVFEEINTATGLTFRYSWSTSARFGFIRTCHLINTGGNAIRVRMLDGLRNILPGGLDRNFNLRFSNLADAYKKNELVSDPHIGVYYLSSIPTDKAEPSEGLKASVVWQTGLPEDGRILISDDQLERFRCANPVQTETDTRARRGAFLHVSEFEIPAGDFKTWKIVADVDHDQTTLAALKSQLNSGDIQPLIKQDVRRNEQNLLRLISAADGVQAGRDRLRTHRHQNNVIFNMMRGGTPLDGYSIDRNEFLGHIFQSNRSVFETCAEAIQKLPETVTRQQLLEAAGETGDIDLMRIAFEYLPLTFSRRHGDPTRPWNEFSIESKNPDGTRKLQYQGNWRDIFQNWEALAHSFPLFLPAMVKRFVNASTIDGYNPYRVTSDGFDWEKPDPHDPWANIGYWGDHQIVYLLKLLEGARAFCPQALQQCLHRESCVYADVPYRIRGLEAIKQNPRSTIDYDESVEAEINARVTALGADGQLVLDRKGAIQRASLIEKILVTSLTKMSNLVPGGGLWLNTQRPEWNDANNALVGRGLSVVTTCYLRRFFTFLRDWIGEGDDVGFTLAAEVGRFIESIAGELKKFPQTPGSNLSDADRFEIVEGLQKAGEAYRNAGYQRFSGDRVTVQRDSVIELFSDCIRILDDTIRANRRADGLYHSYNLLMAGDTGYSIEHLEEMLEGQVAVLESGILSTSEVVELLRQLRTSRLYREDQHSYLLYPNRELARFEEKNNIDKADAQSSPLVLALTAQSGSQIVHRDVDGNFHFDGSLKNADDLKQALRELVKRQPEFSDVVDQGSRQLLDIYEETFHHRQFTGRSSTFFAYEGLGSIYWHMVSKLMLAVNRHAITATGDEQSDPQITAELIERFREIRDGIGVNKRPDEYGAFPTDPYSHTPEHAGAQQPGMTGQVKEDILSRMWEIGVRVENGILGFDPALLADEELLDASPQLTFYNIGGELQSVATGENGFGFTICQVPVVIRPGERNSIRIHSRGGEVVQRDGRSLTAEESGLVFSRAGSIEKIEVEFKRR